MTSQNFVHMLEIKFHTKRILRILYIWKTKRMFCNCFMEQPS